MRSRPRRPLTVLTALALATALLGAACSDAHSQAERDRADVAGSPSVLTILSAPTTTPALQQLGLAYTADHPGTTFVFLTQVDKFLNVMSKHPNRPLKDNSRLALTSPVSPSLWVDASSNIRHLPADKQAYGKPALLGFDHLEQVALAGNPFGVTGLSDFGAGGTKTGLCQVSISCGLLSAKALAAARIRPHPEVTSADTNTLLRSLDHHQIATTMLTTSTVAASGQTLLTVPTTGAPLPFTEYQMLPMAPSALARAFVTWVTTSAAARYILATAGFLGPGQA